jgi:hypothetical protein
VRYVEGKNVGEAEQCERQAGVLVTGSQTSYLRQQNFLPLNSPVGVK